MVYNSDHALHATRHATYIRKCTGHESAIGFNKMLCNLHKIQLLSRVSRNLNFLGNFCTASVDLIARFVRSLRDINSATPVVGHGILLLFIVTLYVNSLVKCAAYSQLYTAFSLIVPHEPIVSPKSPFLFSNAIDKTNNTDATTR